MSTLVLPVTELAEEVDFSVEAHEYRDSAGRVCRSVTQVIKDAGLIDYSHVPTEVLNHASWRGTMVHDATSQMDQGRKLRSCPDEIRPYLDAYAMFLHETGFSIWEGHNEHRMLGIVGGVKVAGTVDRFGELFGQFTVLEIKTCAASHPSWGPQTSGYKKLLCANHPRLLALPIQRCAVQLLRTGKYKLHAHLDDEGDHETFCAALHISQWKRKHNLLAA